MQESYTATKHFFCSIGREIKDLLLLPRPFTMPGCLQPRHSCLLSSRGPSSSLSSMTHLESARLSDLRHVPRHMRAAHTWETTPFPERRGKNGKGSGALSETALRCARVATAGRQTPPTDRTCICPVLIRTHWHMWLRGY